VRLSSWAATRTRRIPALSTFRSRHPTSSNQRSSGRASVWLSRFGPTSQSPFGLETCSSLRRFSQPSRPRNLGSVATISATASLRAFRSGLRSAVVGPSKLHEPVDRTTTCPARHLEIPRAGA
jgi:hypothetical protein